MSVVFAANRRTRAGRNRHCPAAGSNHARCHAACAPDVPGNVYNFGANMPARLQPDTPHADHAKGRCGFAMEQALADAAAHRGVQSVVIRAGEFIGGGVGNWFDNTITKSIGKGRLTYPDAATLRMRGHTCLTSHAHSSPLPPCAPTCRHTCGCTSRATR